MPTSHDALLPRGTPEQQGLSSQPIHAFIKAADQIDALHSFMLVRHGHVVAEGWWEPHDARTPHMFYSLSKSFTSTGVGLAIEEGKLSLDDEVLKFFAEDAPSEPSANLRSMRVRDLLRMNTGHQDEPALGRDEPESEAGASWSKKFLAHPVPFKPGTHFLYNTPATYMLSAIVQKVTGQTLLDYLRPRLFEPLGFENPNWAASPQGITVGGYGLLGRTEDIARFGQLYLQGGQWRGRQLLPASWVREASAFQTSNGSSPTSDWDQGYGYQFWRSRHNSFRGDGAFGQYCLVLPEQDAVVAITGGVRDMGAVMNLVWEHLLPAMKPQPLPKDAATHRQLEEALQALTLRLPPGQATAPLAADVSGQWYQFEQNERGIQALSLDLGSNPPALLVRTLSEEMRTPFGMGCWLKSRGGFTNGLGQFLSVVEQPLVGASGAWSADDAFTLKLALCETPFYSTLTLRFEADRLLLGSEHNVSFGSTEMPQLVGRAVSST